MRVLRTFEGYKELDSVLDKISKHGKDSLTDKEKEYLKDWNIDKPLEQSIDVFEDSNFRLELLDVKQESSSFIFTIKLTYQGETYDGYAYVRTDTPQFFTWDLADKYGEEFDLQGSDLYEFDGLLQEMGEKYVPQTFESVVNEKLDTNSIFDLPFINEKDGKYYIKAATLRTFKTFYKKDFTRTFELEYESFVRYLILSWFVVYKGDNELLKKTKMDAWKGLDTPETKSLGMLSRNKLFYINNIGDVIGVTIEQMGDLKHNKNYDVLQKIWDNREVIFTEKNMSNALELNMKKLKGATQSEEDAIEMINKYNLVPNYIAKRVTKDITDKTGIDLWLIPEDKDQGKAKRGQVKAPANAWIKYFDGEVVDTIIIKGSKSLDLGTYSKKEGDRLEYDVLILVDMKQREIYTIPTYIIYSIKQNEKGTWVISLRKRSLKNKDVKKQIY